MSISENSDSNETDLDDLDNLGPRLPENFADMLLEMEMRVEDEDISVNDINQ